MKDDKLSDKEKELIKINIEAIKQNRSLATKIFFAVVTAVLGLIYVLINRQDFNLNNTTIGFFLILLAIFYISSEFMYDDMKYDLSRLIKQILKKERNLEDYKISPKKRKDKFFFALITFAMSFLAFYVLSLNYLICFFIGLGMGVIIYISPRNY